MLASLFPLTCPGCGDICVPGVPVCAACAAQMRPAPAAAPPDGIDAWAAAFAYEGVARELVARVKYRNVRAAVPWLVAHMCDADTFGVVVGPRAGLVVTWPPTTPDRRRGRGFDPGELFARGVARRLALPCRPLLRRLDGPPQTGLPAVARRAGPRLEPARSGVAARTTFGASILVVDDVATTGTTLAAAAAVLRAAGARSVAALTAARTPPRLHGAGRCDHEPPYTP